MGATNRNWALVAVPAIVILIVLCLWILTQDGDVPRSVYDP